MNHRIHVLAAIGALALVGCAPQAFQPAPDINSPASSKAPESLVPLSDTLALAQSPDAVQGPAVEPQQRKLDMQPGMKAMDQGMPGMKHGAHQQGGQP